MADTAAAQPGQAMPATTHGGELCGRLRGWSCVVPTPAAAHGGISRDGQTDHRPGVACAAAANERSNRR
jgi:hypothetical protein